jgi:hypothetical protein
MRRMFAGSSGVPPSLAKTRSVGCFQGELRRCASKDFVSVDGIAIARTLRRDFGYWTPDIPDAIATVGVRRQGQRCR